MPRNSLSLFLNCLEVDPILIFWLFKSSNFPLILMKLHHCRNTVISTSSSSQLVPMSDAICRFYTPTDTFPFYNFNLPIVRAFTDRVFQSTWFSKQEICHVYVSAWRADVSFLLHLNINVHMWKQQVELKKMSMSTEKKMHSLKVESYVLFGGYSEDFKPGTQHLC